MNQYRLLPLLAGSGFPSFLKKWWLACVPIAFLFACELLWEKTWLTWTDGPQMVGFRLFHLWPIPFMAAILATMGTFCWIPVALWWSLRRRQRWQRTDVVMFALALFVVAQALIPDDSFAQHPPQPSSPGARVE